MVINHYHFPWGVIFLKNVNAMLTKLSKFNILSVITFVFQFKEVMRNAEHFIW